MVASTPDESALYDELLRVLSAARVVVKIRHFKTPSASAGGLCTVEGEQTVLLDAGASKAERTIALIESLEQIGLDRLGLRGTDLSPTLLLRLNRRGQMGWPHRSRAPSVAKGWATSPSSSLRLMLSPLPLRHLTTMGLGGAPSRLERIGNEAQAVEFVGTERTSSAPLYVLGGGSNVIVADGGVQGTVLVLENREISIVPGRGAVRVTVGAGHDWHEFAHAMTQEGYAGLECLGGIPGSVGATPVQNVGAYGQEVSQTIEEVRVLSRRTGKVSTMPAAACRFGYRSSIFKTSARDEFVVLSVTFRLQPGGKPSLTYGELKRAFEGRKDPPLTEVFDRVVELRRSKSMVLDPEDENTRSCGSFFVNAQITRDRADAISALVGESIPSFPAEGDLVKVPSAWLIERAGLHKGMRLGPVGLSTKHTLSIVAHEGATATDIVRLAWHVRQRVEATFSVRLIPEPHFWGFGELDDGLPANK